jgi:hypothetical protein
MTRQGRVKEQRTTDCLRQYLVLQKILLLIANSALSIKLIYIYLFTIGKACGINNLCPTRNHATFYTPTKCQNYIPYSLNPAYPGAPTL